MNNALWVVVLTELLDLHDIVFCIQDKFNNIVRLLLANLQGLHRSPCMINEYCPVVFIDSHAFMGGFYITACFGAVIITNQVTSFLVGIPKNLYSFNRYIYRHLV